MSESSTFVSISSLRAKVRDDQGRRQWRSLDDLAQTPKFQGFLKAEFPEDASVNPVSRRDFMKVMGASLAFAGAAGCTRSPKEYIIPYVQQPEQMVPGKPLYYATAIGWQGVGRGVMVESHMGRPTKIEGNPNHPDGNGSSGALMQAAILGMYDPDRSQAVKFSGRIDTWDRFSTQLQSAMERHLTDQGESLRLLMGPVTSPSTLAALQDVLVAYPKARVVQYAPLMRDQAYAGAKLAFGEAVETIFDFEAADIICSFDNDFLYEGHGSLRYARQYAARRQPVEGGPGLNRLYVAECVPSVTGASADHRLAVGSDALVSVALALAHKLGVEAPAPGPLTPYQVKWVDVLAEDLLAHRGRAAILVGDCQPPALHALGHALNAALGAAAHTVIYTEPLIPDPQDGVDALKALTEEMRGGLVKSLIVMGANPAYDAPADIPFADSMQFVPLCVHLGLYEDETAARCQWHVPAAHDLEAWGDLRAFDGTVSIQQPLIEPLYNGKTVIELCDAMLSRPARVGYDVIRATWEKQRGGLDFEVYWKKSIHDGVMADTAFAPRQPKLNLDAAALTAGLTAAPAAEAGALELVIRPDASLWDGSLANNGWLQELPRPITKLTWDNAALISPALAEREELENSDVITLNAHGVAVELPVWIVPGQPANTVALLLGYGRTHAGRVGNGVGVNAALLRQAGARWGMPVQIGLKTGVKRTLACVQDHHSMEGRNLVRRANLDAFQADPHFASSAHHGKDTSLYPEFAYTGHKWGMTIDLNTCTGCNACTIACQAENNIAVVGKEQVIKGREMHWIRVDRYFEGELDNPEILHQPIPCMQCERAPCEVVCPVGATAHSEEGLNDMVYNRCVGTRYCSNNCPYKVRRFNFFKYTDMETPQLKLQRNPDVTVRMRGVMEKCTYCVQRINVARITAKTQDRRIADGEVVTACQQACPVGAIAFGDLNDPTSAIAKAKQNPRNYGLLEDLGVRPRTTYLARLRNPHPTLVIGGGAPDGHGGHGEGEHHGA